MGKKTEKNQKKSTKKPQWNKLFICGSDSILNKEWIEGILQSYSFKVLIVGIEASDFLIKQSQKEIDMNYVDYIAFAYALERQIPIISIIPEWKKATESNHVKTSNFKEILRSTKDIGVVLWNGKSNTEWSMIQKLKKIKRLHKVHSYHVKSLLSYFT